MTSEAIIHHLMDIAVEAAEDPRKALEAWAYLIRIERGLENVKEAIKDAAMSELATYGKEGATKGGLVLTMGSTSKWDYSGVTRHAQLKAELKRVEERAKMANKIHAPLPDDDGVEIEPAVVKKSDTIVCTKIKGA